MDTTKYNQLLSSVTQPPAYLWKSKDATGDPITIYPQPKPYHDMRDWEHEWWNQDPMKMPWFADQKDGLINVLSAFVPPNVELDFTSMPGMYIEFDHTRCPGATDDQYPCNNQGTLKWEIDKYGLYTHLNSRLPGVRLGAFEPIPLSDNKYNGGVGHYSNRMRSVKVRQVQSWDNFKIDCCTGRGRRQQCGPWWGPNDDSKNNLCDSVMIDWCHWNATEPECACIVSEIKHPQCFDTKCFGSQVAYKTANQKEVAKSGCPNYLECNQVLNLSDGAKQNLVQSATMLQRCADGEHNYNPDSPDDWPEGFPDPTDPRWREVDINYGKEATKFDPIAIILVIAFVLALLVAAGIFNFNSLGKYNELLSW